MFLKSQRNNHLVEATSIKFYETIGGQWNPEYVVVTNYLVPPTSERAGEGEVSGLEEASGACFPDLGLKAWVGIGQQKGERSGKVSL